ncbi:SRPBCC domain-containing protein [Inquilinus limosus]|uniref:SRPBCC domain-containing protein n=1 Tax=Inquilinus limosus TaxID=171674 RepID=UPI000416D970|nr:SRPBCC domain-containing protein [Inquilinus limosus]
MAISKSEPGDAAVVAATGRTPAEWQALLDAAGARDWPHPRIVAWLREQHGLSGWWGQSVTVGYERAIGRRALGQTADAGFQVGVSRTLPAPAETVWRLLLSPEGRTLWLGTAEPAELAPGVAYHTADGVSGEIRVVRPGDRLRLTRRGPGEAASSTVQIALQPGEARTVITFHHEKLPDADAREAMRAHWRGVADRFAALVGRLMPSS